MRGVKLLRRTPPKPLEGRKRREEKRREDGIERRGELRARIKCGLGRRRRKEDAGLGGWANVFNRAARAGRKDVAESGLRYPTISAVLRDPIVNKSALSALAHPPPSFIRSFMLSATTIIISPPFRGGFKNLFDCRPPSSRPPPSLSIDKTARSLFEARNVAADAAMLYIYDRRRRDGGREKCRREFGR